MKHANKIILLFIAFVIIAVMILVKNIPHESRQKFDTQQQGLALDTNGAWPMFHGGAKLQGHTQSVLPDSLRPLWKFKTNGEIKSSPAIYEGLVFIGSADANVYAIDLKTGKQVWSYKTADAVEATACVVDGSVYIGSADYSLYALDAKTGRLKWKYETEGKILGSANWFRSDDANELRIIVGSYDSKLHCLNPKDGKAIWSYETDSYVNSTPAVYNGKIIFGGCDGMIHVVSAKDGAEIRRIDAGAYIAGAAAVSQSNAYIGNYENVFMKADIESGKILWKYTGSDAPYFSSPAVVNGKVVFGGRDNRIHCLDTDSGNEIWTFKTLGRVDSSPAICGDKVIVGCEDGRLYMVSLSDGSKVWSFEIGQAINSSPAVVGNMVVIGCDDGYVYAFGPKR